MGKDEENSKYHLKKFGEGREINEVFENIYLAYMHNVYD